MIDSGGGRAGITAAVLASVLAGDRNRPRLTAYRADGARTELSGASLVNWAAKVAGLLVDELGLAVGATAAVRTGTAWQTAPILLGAWWAGLVVTDDAGAETDVAFVPEGQDAEADEVFVVSGHPLGAPSTDVLPHQQDFSRAVLPQADRFAPRGPIEPDAAAVWSPTVARSVREVLDLARAGAERLGPGGRLLSVADWTLPDGVAATVLAALLADGSLVQAEPAVGLTRLVTTEHPTAVLGADVLAMARLDA